ncbi:unnamed protein product [Malus baccata var. baccata]
MAAISALSTSGYSAYAPFLGRFQPSLMDLKKYDIAAGRPKLAAWIEVQNNWIPNLIENQNFISCIISQPNWYFPSLFTRKITFALQLLRACLKTISALFGIWFWKG